MTRMQFGDYLFDYNPRKMELSSAGNLVSLALPGCGATAQNLGARCRVVRCEGELFAATAEAAAQKLSALAAACAPGVAGTLYLPAGERMEAFAARFAYTATGDGRVYTYTLEFLERESGAAS